LGVAQVTVRADPRDAAAVPMREERRIVTALFADITGSTSIAEKLDPEDARDVLGGAVALVIEQVDALGGTVKDLAGDGVLALFGAPVAHEDDAQRAVLCGLRVAEAISHYADDVAQRWGIPGFSVRVGVETGAAVLGPVGAGSRVEYGAVGDVLNTAARLEASAEPGTVLVGHATQSMVADHFEWGAIQSLELKGKSEPVEAAVAITHISGPATTAGALEAPIVGRNDDLARLEQAFGELRSGRGCVVILEGDPGVGKSRLLAECRARFKAAFAGAWLEGAGVSYGSAVPYLPYRNMLLTWLRLPLDVSGAAIRARIDKCGTSWPPAVRSAVADLDPVLSGSADQAPADPEAAQAVVFSAMAALLTGLATERPAAIALEDLHWSDATSVALSEAVAALTPDRPLLLVLTLRAEPGALGAADRIAQAGSSSVRVRLAPLSRESDRELLHALIGPSVLPRNLEERLLDTTDGNPFFMEEQVRALVESGSLVRPDGAWRYTGATTVQLALTIEHALIARIDRLGEQERAVLLAASVLGPRFEAPVLAELVGDDTQGHLAELERDQFVSAAAEEGGGKAYRFRHALVQEAAYRSLLRRQRKVLHARAATVIKARYAGRTDEVAVILGRHLAEAGESERAIGYLLVGARRAAAAFANEETATLCDQALALLAPDPESMAEAQVTTALELMAMKVAALRFLARYDGAVACLRDAIRLTPAGDGLGVARLHVTVAGVLVDAHNYPDALAELDGAEACIGSRMADDDGFAAWLEVQLGRCNVLYWLDDTGRYSEILEKVEPHIRARATPAQQIGFYDAVRSQLWRRDRYVISDELLRLDRMLYEAHRESANPEDRAWAAFHRGMTLMWHRDLREAESLLREALAHADELDETLLRSRALTYLMVTARLRGDVEAAEALIAPVRDAARDGGLPEYDAMAAATAAWASWRRGDTDLVVREGREALRTWERLPNRYPFDWMACLPLIAVSLAKGDVADALRLASPLVGETQQPLPDSIAAHVRAAIDAATLGNSAEAADQLGKAIEAAQDNGYL
jgi:class 3 adenylate cyclase/tetratricopeptide (TPR) repeat protein